MTSPFDDTAASHIVLCNEENQYSLWPTFAHVPAGWEVAFGEAGHAECIEFIEKAWSDMRPKSLIDAMG